MSFFKIYNHITLNINTYFKVNAYICTHISTYIHISLSKQFPNHTHACKQLRNIQKPNKIQNKSYKKQNKSYKKQNKLNKFRQKPKQSK